MYSHYRVDSRYMYAVLSINSITSTGGLQLHRCGDGYMLCHSYLSYIHLMHWLIEAIVLNQLWNCVASLRCSQPSSSSLTKNWCDIDAVHVHDCTFKRRLCITETPLDFDLTTNQKGDHDDDEIILDYHRILGYFIKQFYALNIPEQHHTKFQKLPSTHKHLLGVNLWDTQNYTTLESCTCFFENYTKNKNMLQIFWVSYNR